MNNKFHGPGPRTTADPEQHRLTSRDYAEGRVKDGDKLWLWLIDRLVAVEVLVVGNAGVIVTTEADRLQKTLTWADVDTSPILFSKWFRLG